MIHLYSPSRMGAKKRPLKIAVWCVENCGLVC
nr:MAG TPA: hypothetical protein [Caudoviricetes sp.]